MEPCHNCGRPYDDSFADWTICRECKYQLERASGRETVYIDSLGISWTQDELDEVGGLEEVIKLNKEARVNPLPVREVKEIRRCLIKTKKKSESCEKKLPR